MDTLETVEERRVGLGPQIAIIGEGFVVGSLGDQVVCAIADSQAVVIEVALHGVVVRNCICGGGSWPAVGRPPILPLHPY